MMTIANNVSILLLGFMALYLFSDAISAKVQAQSHKAISMFVGLVCIACIVGQFYIMWYINNHAISPL